MLGVVEIDTWRLYLGIIEKKRKKNNVVIHAKDHYRIIHVVHTFTIPRYNQMLNMYGVHAVIYETKLLEQ